jgi:plastocyanin
MSPEGFRSGSESGRDGMSDSRGARRAIATAAAVIAAAAAVGVAGAGGDRATAGKAQVAAADVTITGRDFFWEPRDVAIQVGDTVTWSNAQGFHNVMVENERLNQPGFPSDGAWNPPPQKTFTAAGVYDYLCEVHPDMAGTITVGDAEPTPTPEPTPEAVPPPGDGPPDDTPPQLGNVTLTGTTPGRVRVRHTVSEPATINVRLTAPDGFSQTLRAQGQEGTWTFERQVANGRYASETWAVDPMGNRSATQQGQVTIGG